MCPVHDGSISSSSLCDVRLESSPSSLLLLMARLSEAGGTCDGFGLLRLRSCSTAADKSVVNGSSSMVKLRGAAEGGGRRVVRERCLGGGRRGGEDGAPVPPPPLKLLSIGVVGIVTCEV